MFIIVTAVAKTVEQVPNGGKSPAARSVTAALSDRCTQELNQDSVTSSVRLALQKA